jgi:hypothetical protein
VKDKVRTSFLASWPLLLAGVLPALAAVPPIAAQGLSGQPPWESLSIHLPSFSERQFAPGAIYYLNNPS